MEKKLTGMTEMMTLLNSKRKAFIAQTHEEQRFIDAFVKQATSKGYNVYSYSISSGLSCENTDEEPKNIPNPDLLMRHIQELDTPKNIFIIKDFHDVWTNPKSKRAIRDYLESHSEYYNPVVFLQPALSIPLELEKRITVVNFDLPTREEIIFELEQIEEVCKKNNFPLPSEKERELIINALIGMTHSEVVDVLKKTLSRHKHVNIEEINAEKEQVIKKTGLLEYITDLIPISDIGGVDLLKEYIEDASFAFNLDEEEASFVDPAKGIVLNGIPGGGKSVLARAIAHAMNLPLLKMSMADIMDSKVGQSEKNIDRALKLAGNVSPCVLWIDEMEKALSGIGSSDKTDGGTMSRVIQTVLSWLSDKKEPVFVVGTANAVDSLPPELTRAGRFDHLFFIGLPSQEEREQIFSIHLKKRSYKIDDYDESDNVFTFEQVEELAKETAGFTGAEIEQAVSEAGRSAFARYKKGDQTSKYMDVHDVLNQIKKTVPISQREPDLISDLRDWAKKSARFASSYEESLASSDKKPKLSLLDFE